MLRETHRAEDSGLMMIKLKPIKKALPPEYTLRGPKKRREIIVFAPGKPPKLRYKPGSYVLYKNSIHEVMFAYRIHEKPHEWIFAIEERKSLKLDKIGDALQRMGAGSDTDRIVYEIFRDHYQVYEYFRDIPFSGDRIHLTNQQMISEVKVVEKER